MVEIRLVGMVGVVRPDLTRICRTSPTKQQIYTL